MKSHLMYNSSATMSRILIAIIQSVLSGLIYYQTAHNIDNQAGLISGISIIAGAVRAVCSFVFHGFGCLTKCDSAFQAIFCGIMALAGALPSTARARGVFYRERASNTYSSVMYSLGMWIVELPLLALCCIIYLVPHCLHFLPFTCEFVPNFILSSCHRVCFAVNFIFYVWIPQ